jgi:hypothetical protein
MKTTSRESRIVFAVRFLALLQILFIVATPVASFGQHSACRKRSTPSSSTVSTPLTSSSSESTKCRMSSIAVSAAGVNSPEDEITRQLERARAALAVSRAKIAAREQAAENEFAAQAKNGKTKTVAERTNGALGPEVPFFATQQASNGTAEKQNGKRELVIKAKNEEGLFTTDGDLMAKLSEEEEWESRSLFEVFQSERNEPEKNPLAERDVAASIFGLRKLLQTDDFQRIFDKRNRFIGEP